MRREWFAEIGEWLVWLAILGYIAWSILYDPPHALTVAIGGTLAVAVGLGLGAIIRRL